MATCYVKKSIWDGLTTLQKEGFAQLPEELEFGIEPPVAIDESETLWVFWDDNRLNPRDSALVGVVLSDPALLDGVDPEGDIEAELNWPIPGLDETENPWQTAFEAQSPPASVALFSTSPLFPPYYEDPEG